MTQSWQQHLKRNVNLQDKRTSLVLDAYHWARLDLILADESLHLDMLVQDIELRRGHLSLASACRIFILMYMNCKMEQLSARQALHHPGQDNMVMESGSDSFQPPALFQALSLLARYAGQSS